MKRWLRRLALAVGLAWSVGASGAMAQDPVLPSVPSLGPILQPPAVQPVAIPVTSSTTQPVTAFSRSAQPTYAQPVATEFSAPGGVGGGAGVPVVPLDWGGNAPPRGRAGIFKRHGYCCGVENIYPGCSNLHQELRFIFGSCRTFFGETCLPRSSALSTAGEWPTMYGGGPTRRPCSSCGD